MREQNATDQAFLYFTFVICYECVYSGICGTARYIDDRLSGRALKIIQEHISGFEMGITNRMR